MASKNNGCQENMEEYMATLKCKMCGGSLDIMEGATIGVCQYCGTKQTLPRIDSERKANLYDRADHYRRNNEFDKAENLYEQVLIDDPSDAETYWSLVLCRYGIEYVEDPSTHKRIPTVNRTQFNSVFSDENYKKALEYADALQKEIYESEAKVIDDIRKQILEISRQEEPFDIFLCYKETDDFGQRTPDSVLAYDLYSQLTKENYRVFFARVTLEDKLGTAYEPFIFSALQSARVMIVLGTKTDNFNAPWVKNEWNRYLAMINAGENKVLIPAYKDMDPYDLPGEFAHLQAQDLNKLGASQDLLHFIAKRIKPSAEVGKAVPQHSADNSGSNVERLLQNGETYLKLGNLAEAKASYQSATKEFPEDYRGWWGLIVCNMENLPEGKELEYDFPYAEIDKCFANVKTLCPPREYPTIERRYIGYQQELAKLQAVNTEKQFKEKYVKASETRIQQIESEIRMKEQTIKAVKDPKSGDAAQHAEKIRSMEQNCEHRKAIINSESVKNTIMAVAGGACIVIAIIIMAGYLSYIKSGGNPLLRLLPAIIFAGAGGALFGKFLKRNKTLKNSKSALTECQQQLQVLKGEEESIKQDAERKAALEEEQVVTLNKELEEERERLIRLERYPDEHYEEITNYFLAKNCRRVGITIDAPESIDPPAELIRGL